MLLRIPEPELMDTPDEACDYDSMDHAEVNHRFVDDLLNSLATFQLFDPRQSEQTTNPLTILDLGTGTAQIPIELCRRSDRIEIVAVDAAAHMLAVADKNIRAAKLQSRIRLQQVDAKRLPLAASQFDCVISNSIIHHLSDPVACLAAAVRVVRPGGLLFFRDLFRPDTESELAGLVDRYAPPAGISPASDHQRAMFADSLRSALTVAEIRDLIADLGFPPDSVRATSDRHWTWAAVRSKSTTV
jgi:ubiquinone/menaquinone biosynthesis C-methylase UbiE